MKKLEPLCRIILFLKISWIIIEPLELMAFRYIFPFMKVGDKKEQCNARLSKLYSFLMRSRAVNNLT